MVPVAALLMQAAVPEIDFNLGELAPAKACTPGQGDEIVVCGRPETLRHRVEPLPDALHVEPPIRAETRLFGDVVGSAVVESTEVAPGIVSDRIMVTIKIPF